MKFSIGDIAVQKTDVRAHTSYNPLKVIGVLNEALLLEHCGTGYGEEIHEESYEEFNYPGSRMWREGILRCQEEELFTPEETVAELRRLEAAEDKLTQEFEAVRDDIQGRMERAADLVKEAADIVKAHNRKFSDLKSECMSLYEALDIGGWSHSHMRC